MAMVTKEAARMFREARPVQPSIDEYAGSLEAGNRMTPVVREAIEKARAIRFGHHLIFYIAGGLTGVSDELKQRYTAVGNVMARKSTPGLTFFGYAPHLHGTDPVRHPDVTPAEVRDIDYLWAAVVPDGHINFMFPMAHGNAIEAGWAEEHGIPALHIVPDDMTTSRLVRGLRNTIGTVLYRDFSADGLSQIEEFLDGVTRSYHGS